MSTGGIQTHDQASKRGRGSNRLSNKGSWYQIPFLSSTKVTQMGRLLKKIIKLLAVKFKE